VDLEVAKPQPETPEVVITEAAYRAWTQGLVPLRVRFDPDRDGEETIVWMDKIEEDPT
jgi:hypothetical protein